VCGYAPSIVARNAVGEGVWETADVGAFTFLEERLAGLFRVLYPMPWIALTD